MNPSATRIWNIPPPPGTEEEELSNASSKVESSTTSGSHTIDRVDPSLKNPECVDYETKNVEKSKQRSRSKSHERYHRRHSRSKSRDRRSRSKNHPSKSRDFRSRSKDRHRRSQSRSHRRHRRKRSSSRSRSKSPGYRHNRRRHGRRRRSHSRSPSRSASRSRSHRSRRFKSERNKRSNASRKSPDDRPMLDADINEVDMKIEEEEEEEDQVKCVFKNDGSFLEMFKKMQEQQKAQETVASTDEKKPLTPAFGKRRGGKVLKTGLVQKVRLAAEEENNAQDAWSVYMKEVRRYKEACCDDDSKTRPLVK